MLSPAGLCRRPPVTTGPARAGADATREGRHRETSPSSVYSALPAAADIHHAISSPPCSLIGIGGASSAPGGVDALDAGEWEVLLNAGEWEVLLDAGSNGPGFLPRVAGVVLPRPAAVVARFTFQGQELHGSTVRNDTPRLSNSSACRSRVGLSFSAHRNPLPRQCAPSDPDPSGCRAPQRQLHLTTGHAGPSASVVGLFRLAQRVDEHVERGDVGCIPPLAWSARKLLPRIAPTIR